MLLAVDIGNSNVVLSVFENHKILNQWRINSSLDKSTDDFAVDIIELLLTAKIDILTINRCIIASVVPTITGRIEQAIKKIVNNNILKKIIILDEHRHKLPITINLKNKNEIGIDRLVNSIIAYQKFGLTQDSLIIVDFGTATTFDVVGSGGEYLGGAISPGLNLSLKSLHEMTAQLPKINVKAQKNVIGKNTIEAMNSGVYFGYIAMIEGMVNRIENELQTKTRKIITGGLAEIFKTALCIDTTEEDFIKQPISNYFFHSPNLTVEGLEMLYHKLY